MATIPSTLWHGGATMLAWLIGGPRHGQSLFVDGLPETLTAGGELYGFFLRSLELPGRIEFAAYTWSGLEPAQRRDWVNEFCASGQHRRR